MNEQAIKEILNRIEFSHFGVPFQFNLQGKGDGFLLQVQCETKCQITDEVTILKGRKYYISRHSIMDEIVNTAFAACKSFVEHEARHSFRYRGYAIYHPHWQVDGLAAATRHYEPAIRKKKSEVLLFSEDF